jgi:hypothetical protein
MPSPSRKPTYARKRPLMATSTTSSDARFYHYRRGRSPGYNAVVAADPDSHVLGHLSWGPNGTKVQTVWVQPDRRRQGLATALWQHARAIEPELAHHTDRSDAGDAWVRSLRDGAPERTHNTVEGDVERRGEFAQRAHEERLKAGRFTSLPGAGPERRGGRGTAPEPADDISVVAAEATALLCGTERMGDVSDVRSQPGSAQRPGDLHGYQRAIGRAIGSGDLATIALTEELMRVDRDALDGLDDAQFAELARLARTAADRLQAEGELAGFCRAFRLEVPDWAATDQGTSGATSGCERRAEGADLEPGL